MITSSLKIMLWDKEIGRLSWDGRRGISYFEFNPAVIAGELDPFNGKGYSFIVFFG
ncbi:MAG: HipA N-terminal domain-containing protein [Prevotellaceae bacterium]|nr:HipA N-terminal domain-containing protein [Candidatus Minthosoma equi]